MHRKYTLILAYHALLTAPEAPLPPESSRSHAVLLEAFWRQLDILRAEGWHSMLPEEMSTVSGGDRKRRFIITFDDGHQSDLLAASALRTRGYRAIFYVPWEHVGKSGFLGDRDITELARQGFGIGSHGLTHTPLAGKPEAVLRAELSLSRENLETLVGRAIIDLALPFGRYDAHVIRAARDTGFARIMTSDIGLARSDGAKFPRMPVSSRTSESDFRALLSVGPAGAWLRRLNRAIVTRTDFRAARRKLPSTTNSRP